MFKVSRPIILFSILLYIIYVIFIPTRINYDVELWAQWAADIWEHGLGKVYEHGSNYLPGHLFEMKLYTLFFNSREDVISHIYYLKYFTLLFDLGGAMLVASLVERKNLQLLVFASLALNPAYLHNNLFWGQFDSVFTTIVFASFILAYKNRFIFSLVMFVFALNFKLQSIILFPPLLLLILSRWDYKFNIKKLVSGLALIVLVQYLFLLPFIFTGSVNKVLATLHSQGGQFGKLSLNASNIWYFLFHWDVRWFSDNIQFRGLPYKTWGLLMAAVGYLIVLFPLIFAAFKQFRNRNGNLNLETILLSFSLCVLVFFYFNTQMHERYSFPAFPFIAGFAAITRHWWIFLIFSGAYFLNNEVCLQAIQFLNHESPIFDFRSSSGLFLLLLVVMTGFLYFYFFKNSLGGKRVKEYLPQPESN